MTHGSPRASLLGVPISLDPVLKSGGSNVGVENVAVSSSLTEHLEVVELPPGVLMVSASSSTVEWVEVS